MTPKQTARDLVNKYHAVIAAIDWEAAKQCALITAHTVSSQLPNDMAELMYWHNVKKEIEKL